jgi:hypothetical protein
MIGLLLVTINDDLEPVEQELNGNRADVLVDKDQRLQGGAVSANIAEDLMQNLDWHISKVWFCILR